MLQPTAKRTINPEYLLRAAAACLLLGRAWQHIFWDVKLGALFREEALLGGIVRALGAQWRTYAESEALAQAITGLQWAMALLFLAAATIAIIGRAKHGKWLKLLPAASVWMFVLAAISWKTHQYQFVQFFEHAAQVMAPTLLYLSLAKRVRPQQLLAYTKITVAVTFVCHGLFALGFPYPQPGNFVYMTETILGLDEVASRNLLIFWGLMDLLVSVGLFIPVLLAPSVIYATMWGLATALARVVGYFDGDAVVYSLHSWLYQTIFRMPHALLPLSIWFMMRWGIPTLGKQRETVAQ